MRFLLFVLTLWIAVPALADDLEIDIPVSGPGTLRIELESGDVDVIAHDAPQVRLEARARGLGASGIHFSVREEAGTVVLESRSEAWLAWLSRGPSVRVRAWVPRSTSLAVETAGAVVSRNAGVFTTPRAASTIAP